MLALNEKWQHFEYSIRPRKIITFLLVAILGVSFERSARAGTCKNAPVILAHFNLSGPSSVRNIGGYAASPAVEIQRNSDSITNKQRMRPRCAY